ncbi:MAG: Zn-dependent hydrolase [Bacteroidales bacterium]|nr:Zn-dependent hydrolase [Bacteroidales bacterium]
MKKLLYLFLLFFLSIIIWTGCKNVQKETKNDSTEIQSKVDEFIEVSLKSDLINNLSDNQKELLGYLFNAADIMNDIYWKEAFGDKESLHNEIDDPATIDFVNINFGPWERLNGNEPFLENYGPKPAGANFYPADLTKEEFETFADPDKASLYTIVIRDDDGTLKTVPYHIAFQEETEKTAELLLKAADLADNESFKTYLKLRADALLTDDYFESDMAWMDLSNNDIDIVIGPIENYEDGLFNYKAAHEAFVLLKDQEWSKLLEKFAGLLPELQKSLPVDEKYKTEVPGSDSDLGVYDVVFCAGDCNAGSKTIAINLPNDERVHAQKGSRKLQLKNAMQYKFDKILVPISNVLITEEQRKHVRFDAFFQNVMFHETAHGLGINNTINDKGTVRHALKEQYSAIEEGKADIVGLFLVKKLAEMGEFGEKDLMDNYVTFMASIFRSIRFGVASSHGKANMIRFYFFQEQGAFTKDEETGMYSVNFDKMTEAMELLANKILVIQGNGDYEAAKKLVEEKGFIRDELQNDLDRISEEGIPRDIRFIQGKEVVGLF